jgi:protoporphyrinogen oxidase
MATIQIKDGKNLQFFMKPVLINLREELLTKLADHVEKKIETKSKTVKSIKTNEAVVIVLSNEQDVTADKIALNKAAKEITDLLGSSTDVGTLMEKL